MSELRNRILQASDLPREPVAVPEWGVAIEHDDAGAAHCALWARTLSAAELYALKKWWREGVRKEDEPSDEDIATKTVIVGLEDEAGKPVFRPEDLAAVKTKSPVALYRIWAALDRLNGISEKSAEAIRKNCETTPTAGSCSGSRVDTASSPASSNGALAPAT